MTTKERILEVADNYIKVKGYNAFSFHDLSKDVGIKTSSIHYYFPTKADLGVAIIKEHQRKFHALKEEVQLKSPLEKLEAFFSIYQALQAENKVCLVGSLATDLNTVEKGVKSELKAFTIFVLEWVTKILEEGRRLHIFHFSVKASTKAMMVIGNMLAIVQLCRLTGSEQYAIMKQAIIDDLTINDSNNI